jgi:diguanylate cyclase (GGDEF)-like protein/PAS domain S-box-containing protein
MFQLITPISYWVLTVLWLVILWLYIVKFKQTKNAGRTVAVLLVILAIDAFRTVFESVYFGLYFNSLFGLLPTGIHDTLSHPALLIIPKILNILAGLLVLFLLIRHWVPKEMNEREQWIENLQEAKLTAENKREEAVQQTSKFESILNAISDAIVVTDTERRIVSVNKGMRKTFGYTIDDLAGKKTSVLYESQAEFEIQGRVRFNLSAIDKEAAYEVNYRRKDGQVFVGETLGTVIKGGNGTTLGFIGVIRDVRQRKKDESRLKLSASVFTHAQEGIVITDASSKIIDVNDAFIKITGYSRSEIIGRNPRVLQSGVQDRDFYAEMWESLHKNKHWIGEIWNRRKNGEIFPEILTISAVCDQHGEVQHYVGLSTDITSMKNHQKQLERIAHYDPLTGLPNRALFADRLRLAIKQSDRREKSIAVVYLDLDDFKAVNDTYGHSVGDQLLVKVSQRMEGVLRDSDTLSRLGGDEFIAILTDMDKVEDCEPLISRLLKAASAPVFVENKSLSVASSIGVTLYPQDPSDADLLIRHADQAMYTAKQNGKNHYHFFDVLQNEAIINQRNDLHNIRDALERREFVLYYQPKVNMRSGEVIGAEALIRWQHPESGLLAPGEFLPIIENHPLAIELGDWVIETAVAQMDEWRTMELSIPVSVNVGARHLQSHDFVSKVSETLSRYPHVKPGDLEFEILETSALEDIEEVSKTMHACINIGLSFALDDFGTGYSSLTYLKYLPAQLLKIDQSFVRDMLIDVDDRAIVSGVIGLANSFHRNVIAEGVETIEHGCQLIDMGCDLAQGYGIARPMPAGDVPKWVLEWNPDESFLTNK